MIKRRLPGRSWIGWDPLGAGLFWTWNLIFVAFMLLGFGPALLPELLRTAGQGDVPWTFVGLIAVLTAVPLVALLLGYWRLRGDGRGLFALGFAVEGPLMGLLALRVFGFREANPAMALLLALMFLGLSTYLWQLLDPGIAARGREAQLARWTGLCLLALAGVYAAVWAAFYLPPFGLKMVEVARDTLAHPLEALRNYWNDLWHEGWSQVLFGLLLPPTAILTAVLVFALPVLSLGHWLAAWRRAGRDLAARFGRRQTAALGLGTAVAAVLALVLASRQPQAGAFAALERPPADTVETQALLERSGAIREGLLNAYLSSQRYRSARGEQGHIYHAYRSMSFGGRRQITDDGGRQITDDERQLISDEAARQVQAAYERVAGPLYYQPAQATAAYSVPGEASRTVLQADPRRAAELYQAFFDAPIDLAERETIVRTISANWNLPQASLDLLAIDDREVLVSRRDLSIRAAADGWAELELHEVYQNQTYQQQEVVYHFNLPESAAVTGLWLGETEDRAQAAAFRVAPRGAAQQVYKEERARRVDPALLEQIGPRQYRLRVFPVPARRWRVEGERNEAMAGPGLHLWMTFVVPARPIQGVDGPRMWPLPRLAERRNAYWDRSTEWTLPEGVAAPQGDAWLPDSLPAEPSAARPPDRVSLGFGAWRVEARPAASAAADGALRMPRRLAVVVDRSRSMEGRRPRLDAALAQLSAMASPGSVDVILSSAEPRGEPASLVALAALRPEQLLAFGGQDPAELLRQLRDLAPEGRHDVVLVLTDDSPYRLGGAASAPADGWSGGPIWLVHLGDGMPLGYDDGTLDAVLASGGGVAGSVDEALRRWKLRQVPDAGETLVDLLDGWSFKVERSAGSQAEAGASGPIRKAAARQAILAQIRAAGRAVVDMAERDRLQALAKAEGVVSPFSSMIVLIDERQRQRLDALEGEQDRFERETDGAEGEPALLAVTAVPEPETWLLLLVAAGLLWWQRRLVVGRLETGRLVTGPPVTGPPGRRN
ncbi:MAG: TIGR02921 family PEP-CTERM protein [Anaerolineae bacterium]